MKLSAQVVVCWLATLALLPAALAQTPAEETIPEPVEESTEEPTKAEEVIPKAVPVDTYRPVWENSPFQLEAPAPEAVDVASFAQDLVLAGVIRRGEKVTLTILDKQTGDYSQVTNDEDAEGIRVVEIEYDPNPQLVTARIELAGEQAEIGYDDKLFAVAARPAKLPVKPKGANPIPPRPAPPRRR